MAAEVKGVKAAGGGVIPTEDVDVDVVVVEDAADLLSVVLFAWDVVEGSRGVIAGFTLPTR